MNHNFADWETTQLLPENNPYRIVKDDDYLNSCNFKMQWYNIDDVITIQPSSSMLSDRGFDYLRDAWTFEDIRLYLLSKGYNLNYLCNSKASVHEFEIINTKNGDSWLSDTCYDNYEEARRKAIIQCLNLILKNDTFRNDL